jgi:aryl-alcohol dehydrogenase-like predicted oxidoreductase
LVRVELRRLGKQGPMLSVIGYGAWEIGGEAYGPNPDEDVVMRAVHAAFEGGINWIDTAEIYGSGRSEILAGKAIRGTAEYIHVATKVAPRPVGTGYEPRLVRRAIEGSLRRLRIEHVDLYQLHWFGDEEIWPLEETWETMANLRRDGLARAVGVSNFDRDQIERCQAVGHVDSLQPHFSMLHRDHEDLIAWCGGHGIGVIAYGPLAYGLLTGKVTADSSFARGDWRSGSNPDHPYFKEFYEPGARARHLEKVERLRPIAARLGVSVGQLALAWAVHRPGVTGAIAGSRSPVHNRENAAAGDVSLGPDDLDEIEHAVTA